MNSFFRKFPERDWPEKKRVYRSVREVLRDMRAFDTTTQAPEISEAYLWSRRKIAVCKLEAGSKLRGKFRKNWAL
jgi:hypothetical protein